MWYKQLLLINYNHNLIIQINKYTSLYIQDTFATQKKSMWPSYLRKGLKSHQNREKVCTGFGACTSFVPYLEKGKGGSKRLVPTGILLSFFLIL